MNKLVLLRHGQSQWNLENRFTGWKDVPLTEKGINEANNAGLLLKKNNIKIDKIFSRVLERANKTAEIAKITAIIAVLTSSPDTFGPTLSTETNLISSLTPLSFCRLFSTSIDVAAS